MTADKFEANSLLEAQNLLQRALALDPTLSAAAEGLALTYLNRGEDETDITALEAWDQGRNRTTDTRIFSPDAKTT